MVILDLWGIVFHAMVVIAPIFILLLESIWACCVLQCNVNIAAMHVCTCFTAPTGRSVDTIGGGTKSPKDTKPREASMYVLRVMDP